MGHDRPVVACDAERVLVMESDLAVIERLNQLQMSLDKVEGILTTIRAATGQATQTVEPSYLDLTQACAYLHAPPSTVRKWIRLKGLPYYKPGKELLFRVKELDAWMTRHRQGLSGLALTGFVDSMRLRRSR
jgi:excisionase family DNA binding protein